MSHDIIDINQNVDSYTLNYPALNTINVEVFQKYAILFRLTDR